MVAEYEKKNLIRCFVCLELPIVATKYIAELQQQLKKKNLFYGKFTEPENLHLTLKFLGEIPEEKIEEAKKKLAEIVLGRFEASLGEIGIFINKYNSLLWIKLDGKGVWDLQRKIDGSLLDLGFKKEERFMSHITIARMKSIPSKKEFLEYVKNIKTKKISFQIKEFVLKKSELKEDGPVYSDLGRYNLP